MYIAFLNPQGNFDKLDSFWTEHPDFGGQLVYVKELALAMGRLGHKIDIFTRQIKDDKFYVFSDKFDSYPDNENVRIVRIPCGGKKFLNKELLWENLNEWSKNIVEFLEKQNYKPDFFTGHYADGGIVASILKKKMNIPYSFTGHSLGAQKLDKLLQLNNDLESLNKKYNFAKRIEAERTTMKYADIIFVSTIQEKLEQYHHPMYLDIITNKKDVFRVASPGANVKVFSSYPQEIDDLYNKKFKEIIDRDIDESRLKLPFIISASRLDEKKNHLGLIRTYANDLTLQEKANLAISLRGVENAFKDYSNLKPEELKIMDEIMLIVKDHNLYGKLSFISINSQTELASFYRYMAKSKSIFTLTALYEPFGLAPIEAMSAGLPAVVTKYGGPADVLKDKDTEYGILVDIFDEEKIAKGLNMALDNHSIYQKLGIERVNTTYTWEVTANTYLSEIKKSIKQL
ncbi:MAG: glycosyltransferase [Candidatus Izemoplasmatales bacterium]|nr:glycosyltransferase [Candidatus Izemoplasmatales bacterium]